METRGILLAEDRSSAGPQMSDPKFRRNRRLISSRLIEWFWPPRDAILIAPINAASLPVFGQSKPAARPYRRPARYASPQPVGSTTSAALTQGISIRRPLA